MGKQSDVVYHIPSSFGLVYAGETRWELKMRIPACIDYSDLEPPANTPCVLTHPSHIGITTLAPCLELLVAAGICCFLCGQGGRRILISSSVLQRTDLDCILLVKCVTLCYPHKTVNCCRKIAHCFQLNVGGRGGSWNVRMYALHVFRTPFHSNLMHGKRIFI